MEEVETEVEVIRVTLKCDCGGEMKPTGDMLTVNPPLYPHECEDCGDIINIRGKTYPYNKYSEIKDAKCP